MNENRLICGHYHFLLFTDQFQPLNITHQPDDRLDLRNESTVDESKQISKNNNFTCIPSRRFPPPDVDDSWAAADVDEELHWLLALPMLLLGDATLAPAKFDGEQESQPTFPCDV